MVDFVIASKDKLARVVRRPPISLVTPPVTRVFDQVVLG